MSTLQFYNNNAERYAAQTKYIDVSDLYTDFEECLCPGDRILDLGCGSGRDSKYFLERGYDVVPVDGSAEMCRVASEYLGIPVQQKLFSEIEYREEFDGIWACASLLHVPKVQIRDVMEKVSRALKEQGVLYASFKYGDDEKEIVLKGSKTGYWIHNSLLSFTIAGDPKGCLRVKPSKEAKAVRTADGADLTLRPISLQGEWVKVVTTDGKYSGWIHRDKICSNPLTTCP